MINFKKLSFVSSAGVLGAFAPSVLFAQESSGGAVPTISTMIDPSSLQSTIVTNLGGWVVLALGVALTIFCVFLGWKSFRKGSKTGVSG